MVIRAVVRNGILQPVAPLPAQLREGQEVEVALEPVDDELDEVTPARREAIEAWFEKLKELAIDEEDAQVLDAAIAEERRMGKEDARRQAN